MTDTNNKEVKLNMRFSREEDLTHYTPIVYKLNEKEVIKSGGVTCIGGYCRCIDKNCDCLSKLFAF